MLIMVLGCAGDQYVVKASPVSNMDVMEFETPAPENPCPDQDVWLSVRHRDDWDPTCIVIVHIPKHSLEGDDQFCPAEDTEVIGEGRVGPGLSKYFSMHVLILKKGFLNDPKNYTTKPPKKIEKPADNMNMWHCDL